MSVFVDTSALFALLDTDDAGHTDMYTAWAAGIDAGEGFITTNYAIVEACALIQRALGTGAVRSLFDDILPFIHIDWVTEATHSVGAEAMLTVGRRHLSLVDCVSFAIMRRMGVREYLGLDPHFEEQGFTRYTAAG